MENNEPLVVARLKKGGFTKSATISELLEALLQTLLVDKIYFIAPSPDGKGYAFREAGVVTLDIQPSEEIPDNLQDEFSAASAPKVPVLPTPNVPLSSQEPHSEEISPEPISSGVQAKDVVFKDLSAPKKTGFTFAQPRPQKDLLAERGLEQAPASTARPPLTESITPPKAAQSKRGPRKKKGSAGESESFDLDEAEKNLPKVVSLGGTRQVTRVHTATSAQAAAASQFGKPN